MRLSNHKCRKRIFVCLSISRRVTNAHSNQDSNGPDQVIWVEARVEAAVVTSRLAFDASQYLYHLGLIECESIEAHKH